MRSWQLLTGAGIVACLGLGCASIGKKQECAFLYDECCRQYKVDACLRQREECLRLDENGARWMRDKERDHARPERGLEGDSR